MMINYEMLFERTMQSLLGKKASHIAGQVHSEKTRKQWYKQALKKVVKNIQDIDTNTKHKELLTHYSEGALMSLSSRPYNESVLTLYLLRLISALLGYMGTRPYRIVTLAYFQEPSQYYTEIIASGGDTLQDYYDEKDTLTIKTDIIKQLKEAGITDFKISQVLNISEYQVKKLKKAL